MQNRLTLKRHADLVDRMAAAQGIDLQYIMMAGHLRPGALDDAILACTGCEKPETCEHWLTAHQDGDAAPDYCRNAALMRGLTARLGR